MICLGWRMQVLIGVYCVPVRLAARRGRVLVGTPRFGGLNAGIGFGVRQMSSEPVGAPGYLLLM